MSISPYNIELDVSDAIDRGVSYYQAIQSSVVSRSPVPPDMCAKYLEIEEILNNSIRSSSHSPDSQPENSGDILDLHQKATEVLHQIRRANSAMKWLEHAPSPGLAWSSSKAYDIAAAVIEEEYEPIQIGRELGSGAEGVVKHAYILQEPCVVKHYTQAPPSDAEKQLITTIEHPNILACIAIADNDIYFPCAGKGSLETFLIEQSFNSKNFKQTVQGIAEGIHHLHRRGYVHRDIKPANILLFHVGESGENNLQAKIADFGLIQNGTQFICNGHGTPQYQSPEYIRAGLHLETYQAQKGQAVDVWAFGMVLWYCLKKTEWLTPFDERICGENEHYMLDTSDWIYFIANETENFTLEELREQLDKDRVNVCDPEGTIIQLIHRCLHMDPIKRPSMQEICGIVRGYCGN